MSPDNFARLKEVLLTALRLPEEERVGTAHTG